VVDVCSCEPLEGDVAVNVVVGRTRSTVRWGCRRVGEDRARSTGERLGPAWEGELSTGWPAWRLGAALGRRPRAARNSPRLLTSLVMVAAVSLFGLR
jgi:hypothetical protein